MCFLQSSFHSLVRRIHRMIRLVRGRVFVGAVLGVAIVFGGPLRARLTPHACRLVTHKGATQGIVTQSSNITMTMITIATNQWELKMLSRKPRSGHEIDNPVPSVFANVTFDNVVLASCTYGTKYSCPFIWNLVVPAGQVSVQIVFIAALFRLTWTV